MCKLSAIRDLDTIDSELRLIAALRWSIREHGGEPSGRQVDELLDERLSHHRLNIRSCRGCVESPRGPAVELLG